MRISQSPSSITLSSPQSRANSSAFLAANASTSTTVPGRGICWEENHDEPVLISNNNPYASPRLLHEKSSIEIYFINRSRWWLPLRRTMICRCNPCSGLYTLKFLQFVACYSTWSKAIDPLPSRRLFLWFHKNHTTVENSSGSLSSANPMKSMKFEHLFKLSAFHTGIFSHRAVSFGHLKMLGFVESSCVWFG